MAAILVALLLRLSISRVMILNQQGNVLLIILIQILIALEYQLMGYHASNVPIDSTLQEQVNAKLFLILAVATTVKLENVYPATQATISSKEPANREILCVLQQIQ